MSHDDMITSESAIIDDMALRCWRAGGQGKLAAQLGFSAAMMSAIMNRKKQIPQAVLAHLGYERKIIFIKLPASDSKQRGEA